MGRAVTMRFLALAAVYDGTLAHHGRVDEATLAALQRVRASGRRLLLVTGRELRESPPVSLVSELRAAGVDPLSVGRVVVATVEPHQVAALETIHRLGLGHKVVFNKGAVMLLPAGVDKASGLAVALGELGIGPERTVGIGDAENDHALFRLCGVGA